MLAGDGFSTLQIDEPSELQIDEPKQKRGSGELP
jgi:hypothetical protein